jgi:hypothetical protein
LVDRLQIVRVEWAAVVGQSTSHRPLEEEHEGEFQTLETQPKTISVELGITLSTVKQRMEFG